MIFFDIVGWLIVITILLCVFCGQAVAHSVLSGAINIVVSATVMVFQELIEGAFLLAGEIDINLMAFLLVVFAIFLIKQGDKP